MRGGAIALLLWLAIGLAPISVHAELTPAAEDQVAAATVLIVALIVEMQDGVIIAEAWREPLGSGVLVSAEGLVLTNSHVIDLTSLRGKVESEENALGVDLEIEDAFLLYVVDGAGGTPEPQYTAIETVNRPAVDVAVLTITGDERGFALRRSVGRDRSPIELAEPFADKPRGVLHIFGYPFFGSDALGDLEGRTIATVDGPVTSLDSGAGFGNITRMHIDATVSSGSSGGPVVDDSGLLLGIMAQARGGAAGGSEAIAIPVNRIRPVLGAAGWVAPMASPEPAETPRPAATPTPSATSSPAPTSAPPTAEPAALGIVIIRTQRDEGQSLGAACYTLTNPSGDQGPFCDDDNDGYVLARIATGEFTATQSTLPDDAGAPATLAQTATMGSGGAATITFIHGSAQGQVEIFPVDAAGTLAIGGCYKLRGETEFEVCDNERGDPDRAFGVVLVEYVPPGSYSVAETRLPEGETVASAQQTIAVASGETLQLTMGRARAAEATATPTPAPPTATPTPSPPTPVPTQPPDLTPTPTPPPATGTLVILVSDQDGRFVPQTCFTITGPVEFDRICDRGDDGRLNLPELPAGDYRIRQIQTAPRHVSLAEELTTSVAPGAFTEIEIENAYAVLEGSSFDPVQYRGNAAHTGAQPGPGPLEPPGVLWGFAAEGQVESSPAVVGDLVYFGSLDGNLYAVEAQTGTERWRFTTGGSIWTSPAVAAGLVYIGSEDGNLYAIDAATGAERWTFAAGNNVEASPTVAGGIVYVGSWDGFLYALDAATGTERWRFEVGTAISDAPAVEGSSVFVMTSGGETLIAVDAANGTERWRYATTIDGYNADTPPAVANGIAYFSNISGYVYAVDAETGAERWRFGLPGQVRSPPAIGDGTVFIASELNGVFIAIDAVSGTERWRFAADSDISSGPSLVGGIVYVASGSGTLYALDAASGTEFWQVPLGAHIGHSSPAVVDGVIYIGGSDGGIYALGDS